MRAAYYMSFVETPTGWPDVVGGLPPRLPSTQPLCATCGSELAFLAQFHEQQPILDFGGVSHVQLYQCPQVDDGCDPYPVLVTLDSLAPPNDADVGVRAPGLKQFGIAWEAAEDPDEIPAEPSMSGEVLSLYRSKAGGAMPFLDALPKGAVCLLQLTEEPTGFNFGGLRAAIWRLGGELGIELV